MFGLVPDGDVVDGRAFAFGFVFVGVCWVSDVECADDGPVGFSSDGGVDWCDAGLSGAPSNSDSE